MDLLLWRWSTAVQVTSLVMIAVFFFALRRTARRRELKFWVAAWVANLTALLVTVFFWFFQPAPGFEWFVRAAYLASKATFVWLFVQGAWCMMRPASDVVSTRTAVGVIVFFGVVGGYVFDGVAPVGVAMHSLIAIVFIMAGVTLAATRDISLSWLSAGLVVRGVIASFEAAAYATQLGVFDVPPRVLALAATFLSVHSSVDMGAEWLLALGAVLAISERSQRQLRTYNDQLLSAQENLRRLVDRDPLTALANRRALPEIFRAVQPHGAALLFFDLDGFKEINDLHGHPTGDAYLKRFAAALRESFRPTDAVIRFGGDEFLVVASGLDRTTCATHLAGLRERLRRRSPNDPPSIPFSVGIAQLPPGGNPDEALKQADEAMYREKAQHTRLTQGFLPATLNSRLTGSGS
jgi:diguanylate cyclase (GGDEF)-like protein